MCGSLPEVILVLPMLEMLELADDPTLAEVLDVLLLVVVVPGDAVVVAVVVVVAATVRWS